MYTQRFFDEIRRNLEAVEKTQADSIRAAAVKLVDTIVSGHSVFVFGCTHAGILAQEMFYRTGGLAVINPLLPPGLTCDVRPITLTSALERLPGFGTKILENAPVKAGDMLVIHSVSGRNSVPVDMAIKAKEMGVYTVALTNVDYSSQSKSRHPSGLRLYEACDMTIDNCGIFGDAAVNVEGLPEKVGPTSTIIGAAILNAVAIEAVAEFIARGITPPVFLSANIDGGDAHNARIMQEYKDQIHYL